MAKHSDKQGAAFVLLADSLTFICDVANRSSDADKSLVSIAREVEKFASVWVRCTTEHGRADMKANARALKENAQDIRTPAGLAFYSLGMAYNKFAECDYRTSNDYALQAKAVAAFTQARVDAAYR